MNKAIVCIKAIAVLTAIFSLSACATNVPNNSHQASAGANTMKKASYPSVSFMVLSDTHLYDSSLGTSGAAWNAYMAKDRKLLKNSEETLKEVIAKITSAKPDFVLITGDLTKDGECQCHQLFAKYLSEIEAAGIKCYVLPGNHDINNPAAKRFLPSGSTESIPNISAEEFASIYKADGYGDAVYRDPASLSYVASPVPGLWVLMLDSARYEHNARLKESVTSGAIREQTYRWIEERLREATAKGIAVIAAEHHPLMEHFAGMKSKYPEYIVNDNWRLAGLLASYNVSLFFSGHYHASSIVMHHWDDKAPAGLAGKYIVDVETGSLVTWPCTFRSVTLSPSGLVSIATSRIDQLPSYAAAGKSFDSEGKRIIEEGISTIAKATMKKDFVPQYDIDRITPQITAAMMAHYAGDAQFQGNEMIAHTGLSFMGSMVVASYGTFIKGLWKTTEPHDVQLMEDNNLTIEPDGFWTKTAQ